MAPPPNPYKRPPLIPALHFPRLPAWGQSIHHRLPSPNVEHKNTNKVILVDDDDDDDKDGCAPPLFSTDKCNGSRLLAGHDSRPRSGCVRQQERQLKNQDDTDMLAVEDTRRQGGRRGGHNHDADEVRKRKGSQPYTGAIAKYSFSPSDVSNKAARFGPDDDDDDDIDEMRPARSGRFPSDDADEARKRKGSQRFWV